MKRSALIAVAIVAALGPLAGCGDDDDDQATTSAPPAELAIYNWEASLVTPNPFSSESGARARAPKGAVIIREETDSGAPRFYVVSGEPALTTADIVHPEAITDPVTDQPALAFDFTEEGKGKFQALTRAVAGSSRGGGQFAIVVDRELLSLPVIDARQYPNGLDGEDGAQISGGFTASEAEELAAGLEQGAGD